jgi:hypothetical protein
MDCFPDIIDRWPVLDGSRFRALARDLGLDEARVRQFRQREWIPPEYWEEIVHAARRRAIAGVNYRLLARLARERAGRDAPITEEVR